MNILLTGCAGFIGARVAEQLLAQGHHVEGVDNFSDAYDVRLKQWRVRRLEAQSTFRLHRFDVSDRDAWERAFAGGPEFDAAINLAARAGVRQSLENPWAYYETNVTGTLNALELCRRRGVTKFVLASSSSVYGVSPAKGRLTEDRPTDQPISPYAASKKAAEVLTHAYHRQFGIDVSVLRYFTVYGPAGRPDMSLFRFIRWIVEGEPVVVYGDGTQERDFTHVDDIARGTASALKRVRYQVINLGSDRPLSLAHVLDRIERRVGKTAQVRYEPAQPADVPATWADIGKAERLLGWRPQVSFDDGLSGAVEWYLQNRDWARTVRL